VLVVDVCRLSEVLCSRYIRTVKEDVMTDAAREAKAEAKAAKARAKELRPFWKKKRWWLLAVVVVVVASSALGSGGSDSDNDSNSNSSGSSGSSSSGDSGTQDTIGTGLGSKDATGDINSLDCGSADEIGFISPSVSVTNNSSKTSTYFITVVAESADGATKYDDTIIMITELAPGQTMTEEGLFTNDIPAGSTCKITEVQRTAS
jgi:hypothetical protein